MAYIESREFTRSTGKSYRIFRTDSIGRNAHQAIDFIKSIDTGKVVEMERLKTLQFIDS